MRWKATALVMLGALLLSGILTGCTGNSDAQEVEQMSSEQTIPEIDTIIHDKIETATFAMG